ncbi:DUF58 domain-containing protein [Pseudoalteromonas sp. MMG010]|uniref:DUF58 domain-containing protein n=1 Tax=Pseudoalteromonas sp. MMG010 TaxID=2822685 RepID=UPI001B39E3DC|nr:DUF58 domain-containing protein [Pseudoalteromonas sp. MMG010]MBQ4832418.1 DUF58 domain-containing protein [Pseudoalteromonas sp. MMG010]
MFIVLLISLLAGYSNIKGLTVSMLNTIPTYAAQSPHMIFNLTTDSTCQGVTLSYAYDKRYNSDCENIDEKITELNLPLPFKNRGFYSLPRVKIASHFPFGLITAWSYIDTQECVAIYPKKINPFNNELNTMQASENTDFKNQLLGSDDFNQLIKHSPEMGLQRISWRHYAKTQSLMAKQFIDNESIHTVFDFNQMQGSSEQRLSKLCFLINDAYESNINFTLKLGVKAVCVDTRLDEKSRFLTMLSQFEENV